MVPYNARKHTRMHAHQVARKNAHTLHKATCARVHACARAYYVNNDCYCKIKLHGLHLYYKMIRTVN